MDEEGWTVQTYKHHVPAKPKVFKPREVRERVIKQPPVVHQAAQSKLEELTKRGFVKK